MLIAKIGIFTIVVPSWLLYFWSMNLIPILYYNSSLRN